jgi:hypothetical protein
MKILMAYISVTDQAISSQDKFLPFTLSRIVESNLKKKEEEKAPQEGEEKVDEEKSPVDEEENPVDEEENPVDEEKKPDGDAEGQGQPPGPGDVQVPYYVMTSKDGLYEKPSITGEDEDENPVFLGLKVYTKKEAVVTVSGRILSEPESDDEDEWEDEE